MIRKATLKDLNEIINIENESFNIHDRFSKEVIKYHIKKSHTYVYEYNKSIIAYLIYIPYKKSIRIYSIAVKKNYRNKKIATKLINHIINIAKKQRKKYLSLEVSVLNKIAINFYKKLGFKPIKQLKKYYHDSDGIKMIKTI